jgi:hypothetical protein
VSGLEYFHLMCTLGMLGVSAFALVAVHPLLARLDGARFGETHRRYLFRATCVAGPLMLGELLSFVYLALAPLMEGRAPAAAWLLSGGPLLGAWLATGLLAAPCHRSFEDEGFRDETLRRLLRADAVKAACWTLRAVGLASVFGSRIG